MATILTKKSDTSSSVPLAADLTNAAGGAELAVNTADKRLYSKTSGGSVVELGTNPSALSLPNGTANGVPYLNGSKVLTSGSALTFDGTVLLSGAGGTGTSNSILKLSGSNANNYGSYLQFLRNSVPTWSIGNDSAINGGSSDDLTIYGTASQRFYANGSEQMRLTSTGLGIGTSSPQRKLHVNATPGATYGDVARFESNGSAGPVTLSFGDSGTSSALPTIGGNGNSLVFGTGAATKMTLDLSGNLGLGVTPSAWNVGKAFEVGYLGNALWGVSQTNIRLTQNAYYASGDKYASTGPASTYKQESGAHIWYTAPSGTAGNAISFTQAMTLDASGNLVIGNTSATAAFDVYRASDAYMCLRTGSAEMTFNTGTGFTGSNATSIWNKSAIPMVFGTNNTERARIDSSGNLLVGVTSAAAQGGLTIYPTGSSGGPLLVWNRASTTTTTTAADFRNAGTSVGNINFNNTSTSYNTSSDYRLKTVIGSITDSGARIDALKPIEYEWKVNGERTRGFLAHEFQEVYAGSVTGSKDAVDKEGKPVYQAMQAGSSEAIADLVAEIQSLRKRLAALESK